MQVVQSRSVTAPRPPELPPPHRLPLIATVAPLVVSIVLFVVTRSPFTLVFAALGPVVAIASTVDARLQRRRASRREALRFAADAARVGREIADAHRSESSESAPDLAGLLRHPATILTRWRSGVVTAIRVGSGVGRSELRYEQLATPSVAVAPDVEATLAQLRLSAAELSAPVEVELTSGIGVAGPAVLVSAVTRSLVLQLASTLTPREWVIELAPGAEDWIDDLPHETSRCPGDGEIAFVNADRRIRIGTAESSGALPRDLDAVVLLAPDGSALIGDEGFRPDLVGREQATSAADVLAGLAMRSGIRSPNSDELPDSAALAELATADAYRPGLAAAVGQAAEGPLVLDLVTDGPHAIVAGTTGSGKSELLLSWVLGMAATRSPTNVSFLFVDFKGGASFGSLLELPHSVGVLTDLDAAQAHRALASLAAELRHRERLLAEHGLRGIDDADQPPFARLVVVVDEYAAMVETLPELHPAFADIAARGRSLGVHLVLCTQRPAGVVRDGILANCALRISLRVTGAADSTAVLGTDAAAQLPARPVGRALVSVGGASPTRFQVARSDGADVDRVRERWGNAPRPRVPWLPPLPAVVPIEALGSGEGSGGIPFALADLPTEQAQRSAEYRPRRDGSLLVVGAAHSGKSGVLAALAAGGSALDIVGAPTDLPALWDFLTESVTVPETTAPRRDRVLLLDDLDAVLARCQEAYQAPVVELVTRLLRDGPTDGSWCVLTTQRVGGALHGLATLCGSQLVLRMPNRAEHALAGGDPQHYVDGLPPGAGLWRGNRVQVASAPATIPVPRIPRSRSIDLTTARLAVVSTRPERFAEALRESAPHRRILPLAPVGYGERQDSLAISVGDMPPIVIADPDLWQSQWSLFAGLQRGGEILFDGCSLAEVRALTRSRELPPPFAAGARPLWLRTTEGELARATLK